jgi:predicted dehydrogenase
MVIQVGLAGIGFMGWIHWLAYRTLPSMRVAAIASRDPRRRAGDWRGIQGNFGPPGEQVDLSGVRAVESLDGLLADPSIDLVDLCLPPNLHADAAVRALEAGKHVFCEKPLALTTADADRMVAAARLHGRLLLVGHVLPFFPGFAQLREAAADGRYGKLLGGSFKRVISDPTWLKDFYDPSRVGGPLVDLCVHDAHLIRMLFGRPVSLVSQGRLRGDVVEYCDTLFRFEDPSVSVHLSGGVIRQQGRGFTHAFEAHFERATLQFEFAVIDGKPRTLLPLTVYEADGRVSEPETGDGDPVAAFAAQLSEVARAVRSGEASPILSGELARDAVAICHEQTASVLAGRRSGT